MDVKVKTGHSEMISSGVIFVAYGETADFFIGGLRFRMFFLFEEKQGAPVTCNRENDSSGEYMAIKCYNFNEKLLARLNTPLHLAEINGKDMTLQFTVSSYNKRNEDGIEKEDMMVLYSWCLDD